jgi:hypothetical protein
VEIWLESGSTVYATVEDPYNFGAQYYSIRVSATGFGGSSTATVSVDGSFNDSYEPDGTSGTATPLVLDVVQDHSITEAKSDFDWFVFTAP